MKDEDWKAPALVALLEWAGPEFAATPGFALLQAKLMEVARHWRAHNWDADTKRIIDRAGWRRNRARVGKTIDRLFAQMGEFEYPEVEHAMMAYLVENLPAEPAAALKAVDPKVLYGLARNSLMAARNLASTTRGKQPSVVSTHQVWDRLGFRDGEWWGPLVIQGIRPTDLPDPHVALGVALADVVARFGPHAPPTMNGNPSRPALLGKDTPWTVLSHFTLPGKDGIRVEGAALSRLVRHQHGKRGTPLIIRDPSPPLSKPT